METLRLPQQIKLGTGQVCLAFLGSLDEGFFTATAACSMAYDKVSKRYNVIDIMDPSIDIQIGKEAVLVKQDILADSPIAIVYATYLASWVLFQEKAGYEIPPQVTTFIDHMGPRYAEMNFGINLKTWALAYFHEREGNEKEAEFYSELMRKEQTGEDKLVDPDAVDVSCTGSVVKVDFSSKPRKN